MMMDDDDEQQQEATQIMTVEEYYEATQILDGAEQQQQQGSSLSDGIEDDCGSGGTELLVQAVDVDSDETRDLGACELEQDTASSRDFSNKNLENTQFLAFQQTQILLPEETEHEEQAGNGAEQHTQILALEQTQILLPEEAELEEQAGNEAEQHTQILAFEQTQILLPEEAEHQEQAGNGAEQHTQILALEHTQILLPEEAEHQEQAGNGAEHHLGDEAEVEHSGNELEGAGKESILEDAEGATQILVEEAHESKEEERRTGEASAAQKAPRRTIPNLSSMRIRSLRTRVLKSHGKLVAELTEKPELRNSLSDSARLLLNWGAKQGLADDGSAAPATLELQVKEIVAENGEASCSQPASAMTPEPSLHPSSRAMWSNNKRESNSSARELPSPKDGDNSLQKVKKVLFGEEAKDSFRDKTPAAVRLDYVVAPVFEDTNRELSYANSQDPGVESQRNALDAVDRFLYLNSMGSQLSQEEMHRVDPPEALVSTLKAAAKAQQALRTDANTIQKEAASVYAWVDSQGNPADEDMVDVAEDKSEGTKSDGNKPKLDSNKSKSDGNKSKSEADNNKAEADDNKKSEADDNKKSEADDNKKSEADGIKKSEADGNKSEAERYKGGKPEAENPELQEEAEVKNPPQAKKFKRRKKPEEEDERDHLIQPCVTPSNPKPRFKQPVSTSGRSKRKVVSPTSDDGVSNARGKRRDSKASPATPKPDDTNPPLPRSRPSKKKQNLDNMITLDTPRRCRRPRVKVLFSHSLQQNVEIIERQKKIMRKLDMDCVKKASECTHFVTDRFFRTVNMLEVIAVGKPVVTTAWLESCNVAGLVLDEKRFILNDTKEEKKHNFSMLSTYNAAQQQGPLFQGVKVFLTRNVKPAELSSIVSAAGGEVLEKYVEDCIVVSCMEDKELCVRLRDQGVKVYSTEFLMKGILSHNLNYDDNLLNLD